MISYHGRKRGSDTTQWDNEEWRGMRRIRRRKSVTYAAVNTMFGAIKLPPQKWPYWSCMETTYGNSVLPVALPPMMRDSFCNRLPLLLVLLILIDENNGGGGDVVLCLLSLLRFEAKRLVRVGMSPPFFAITLRCLCCCWCCCFDVERRSLVTAIVEAVEVASFSSFPELRWFIGTSASTSIPLFPLVLPRSVALATAALENTIDWEDVRITT